MAELPERLREAADAHRPDRERMLARVERAMAAPTTGHDHSAAAKGTPLRDRSPAPWMRVTAVAAAVAGAIGLGSLAVGAVSGDGSSGRSVVTSGGAGAPQPPAAGVGTSGSGAGPGTAHAARAPQHGSGHRHHGSGSHTPGLPTTPTGGTPHGATTAPTGPGSGSGSGTTPTAPTTQSAGVSSSGTVDPHSNPYWTESDVNLSNAQPLTSLTVELRIADNGQVSNNSSFTSATGVSPTVGVEGGYLVYRWTLDPGKTLAPGSYTFAGQFNHAENARDTSGDRYTVTASGTDGPATEQGHF
jgi:hypothetical protein